MKLNDLLDNPTPTVAELAKKYNTDPDHIRKQLTKGIKVELEHTSHEHVARRIALAHLGERLDYYTQLAKIDEKWSTKYKKSIDCGKPKGFSQRAHCAGRKARSAHRKTKSTSVSEASKSTSSHNVTHVTESHSELYDQILTILCDMIDYQFIHNPEKYGEVGAAIVDPDSRIVVALSTPHKGKWRHAEYNAIVAYNKKYGEIPPGSVVITTCSPCSARMLDRHGVSCTHRINELPIPIVYCGFEDPTQHTHLHNFQMVITQNAHIHHRCEKHAQRFMDWELAQQNQHDPDPHSAAAQKANQLL